MSDPQLHLLLSRITELTARAEAAEAERDALKAAIQRVRERHRICTSLPVSEGGCGLDEHTQDDPEVCWECCVEWPCPTIRALDGDA